MCKKPAFSDVTLWFHCGKCRRHVFNGERKIKTVTAEPEISPCFPFQNPVTLLNTMQLIYLVKSVFTLLFFKTYAIVLSKTKTLECGKSVELPFNWVWLISSNQPV